METRLSNIKGDKESPFLYKKFVRLYTFFVYKKTIFLPEPQFS